MSMILRAVTSGTVLAGCGLLAACGSPGASNSAAVAGAYQMPDNATGNAMAALPGLPASLPLRGGPATDNGSAPPVSRLPPAPRPALRQLVGNDAPYAYLDRAASYDDALGDAPPDYAFGYDGVTPWGWQADDGSAEYAEPFDGGYRYYYYEPGADTPYLVRDPDYSYAFDGAGLVAIYDHAGRFVPRGGYGSRWDDAGRYFARARALREAARSGRESVVAANWAAHRAQIAAADASWSAARARDPAWAAYHARNDNAQRAHWQGEHEARAQSAERFTAFQPQGFQGTPPAPGAPATAGDSRRFSGAAIGGAAIAGAAVAGGAALAHHRLFAGPQAQANAARQQAAQAVAGPYHAAVAPAHPGAQRPFAAERQQALAAHDQAERAHALQQHAAAQAPREGGQPRERAIARGGFGNRAIPAAHREAPTPARQAAANRAAIGPQHAFTAPHARAPEMHAAPHMEAPQRAAAPRMEAPRMQAARGPAPHMEAPHMAAPHPASAPHAAPPAGGGGHHR